MPLNVWQYRGTHIFEISWEGDLPGDLADRRGAIAELLGEPFPMDGVCPMVTEGHAGDEEWDYLGTIDNPVWVPHLLRGLDALTAAVEPFIDQEVMRIEARKRKWMK